MRASRTRRAAPAPSPEPGREARATRADPERGVAGEWRPQASAPRPPELLSASARTGPTPRASSAHPIECRLKRRSSATPPYVSNGTSMRKNRASMRHKVSRRSAQPFAARRFLGQSPVAAPGVSAQPTQLFAVGAPVTDPPRATMQASADAAPGRPDTTIEVPSTGSKTAQTRHSLGRAAALESSQRVVDQARQSSSRSYQIAASESARPWL
jgi:hypothetical protein